MEHFFIPEPDKPKWVRCIAKDETGVCNHVMRENSTRQTEHLTWSSQKNNVKRCQRISPQERANLLCLAPAQFIKTPEGFALFKPNKAKRFQSHFVHDAKCERVICRWCSMEIAYSDARMKAHFLQDQPNVQFCLMIPRNIIEEIMASITSSHTLIDMALREHLSRLEQAGESAEAWYSDPATTRLLTSLGRIPRIPGYRPLPYGELVKRARTHGGTAKDD